jgi:hypothetical protein
MWITCEATGEIVNSDNLMNIGINNNVEGKPGMFCLIGLFAMKEGFILLQGYKLQEMAIVALQKLKEELNEGAQWKQIH